MADLDASVHTPADGASAVAQGDGLVGTMGCLVRWNGVLYILGSAHIMTGGGRATGGAPVLQPPSSFAGARKIGDVYTCAPLSKHDGPKFSPDAPVNLLDAALATAVVSQVSGRIGVMQYASGFRASPLSKGDYVQICGAVSGLSGAFVRCTGYRDSIQYGDQFAEFADLVQCDPYARDGDSGAAVLDAGGFMVGVHVAGSDDYSVFCPIQAVLDQWPGIQLVTADAQ